MKQIFSLIAVLLMGYAATAQSSSSPALDTVADAGTVVLSQPSTSYFSGTDGTFTVGFSFKKITGTPAGYAVIQTKVSGNVWVPLTKSSADSFLITNVDSNQHVWFVTGKKTNSIRVNVVGSGTQSTSVKADFIKKL